jgi:hypothetical protein
MRFKLHKVWHLDIYEGDVMVDSIMFHTKWEAEEHIKAYKLRR